MIPMGMIARTTRAAVAETLNQDFVQTLRAKGLLAESNKLTDDPGRVVRRKKTKVLVTDGPYAETKELLGGYFIIKSKNYDEALAHAESCPHLDFGGTIELRQVDAKA